MKLAQIDKNFNSTKVRLKLLTGGKYPLPHLNFNSTKVRLKPGAVLYQLQLTPFQFH